MKVNDALQLYKLPFVISETITGGGFTSYKLTPAGSSATPERLKSKLNALQIATGQQLDIITENNSLYIRVTEKQPLYKYTDYNGYIDYNNPDLPFIVGFNQNGVKLDSMQAARHLLIAGTTGSGKSVFLHNLITTFICNNNNYLYLVDCKMCEFNIYKDNALIAFDVFGDQSAAAFASNVINIMQKRYKFYSEHNINDFPEYKKINPEARRHVLIIDELSDLIHDKQSERVIIPQLLRIAQKGRAAGCHVIIATQRPDSSVINGTLKGNIPTRAAFRTISSIDSRIILDQSGAERLNGNGDMLYLFNGKTDPERLQSPFISLDDISRIA